ncbi:staygreen family protein [Bacillus timonensis]|nr:staygreen family protein [Bacillus timonensis]
MKKLTPSKLSVTYGKGITSTHPILGRTYTLTHSDETGELFLDIRTEVATEKIGPNRDEVVGTWVCSGNGCYYYAYVFIDNGNYSPSVTERRNKIFVKELPLALEAIRYGDRELFKMHQTLDQLPIYIKFDSANPKINRVDYWGTFANYK